MLIGVTLTMGRTARGKDSTWEGQHVGRGLRRPVLEEKPPPNNVRVSLILLVMCYGASSKEAACSVAVELLDLDPQGRWFDPWCGHGKICTAVGPLSKDSRGDCLLLSLINCKSLWIKVSAK